MTKSEKWVAFGWSVAIAAVCGVLGFLTNLGLSKIGLPAIAAVIITIILWTVIFVIVEGFYLALLLTSYPDPQDINYG